MKFAFFHNVQTVVSTFKRCSEQTSEGRGACAKSRHSSRAQGRKLSTHENILKREP